MSIPKEPRQIMINLMYLVLTAMLALNVSAEVINAFFKFRDGLERTNTVVESANSAGIKALAAAVEEKKDYKALLPAAQQVETIIQEFSSYIDGVTGRLDEAAGGIVTESNDPNRIGKPEKFKNKEIPTQFFVDGYEGPLGETVVPEGPVIKDKVAETRQKLVDVLNGIKKDRNLRMNDEEIADIVNKLTLEIDTTNLNGKSWEEFSFDYMPVAACYPTLSKLKTDANTSGNMIINYLSGKVGATVVKFDKFVVVSSPKQTYLLQGDTYEADIFLSAASSQAKVRVSVNGSSLPANNGVATYKSTPSGLGEQSYSAKITVTNPFNGKTETYDKTFKYTVGTKSGATVSADKMNVFYIGVTNPVSVAAGGDFSRINASVSGGGCSMSKAGSGKYNVTCSTPTNEARVTVSAPDVEATTFPFRVKRIPDPIALIAKDIKSSMGTGEIKAYQGIRAELRNFDFEAKCNIMGFEIAYVPKRNDAVLHVQRGGRFEGRTKEMIDRAKPGDRYYFSNIKAKCPGDPAGRRINDLIINVK